jgi:hypothetical protein
LQVFARQFVVGVEAQRTLKVCPRFLKIIAED